MGNFVWPLGRIEFMPMKQIRGNILFFVVAVIITACQSLSQRVSTPYPDSTIQSVVATVESSPIIQPPVFFNGLKTVTLSDGNSPDFIDSINPMPVKPGIYAVYSNSHGTISYVLVDYNSGADLFNFSNMSHEPIMLSAQEMPKFVFNKRRGSITIKDDVIWITDILGGSLKTWHVNTDTSFVVCREPVFSPHGRWMIVDCSHYFDHYLNLIDMRTEKKNKTYQVGCDEGDIVRAPKIIWSSDENKFLYTCTPHRHIYCVISILEDKTMCKQIGNGEGTDAKEMSILSVSPSWKKAVLDMGYMPKNANGLIPGLRIFVADLSCVLNKLDCQQGAIFDLPFTLPYDQADKKNGLGTNLQLYWNKSEDGLIWMTSSSTYDRSFYRQNHTFGWLDLSRNINQIFKRQLSEGTELLGLSPDDKWLLFKSTIGYPYSPQYGLYIVSVKNGAIRYLAEPNNMTNYIYFYGWLTIP